MLITHEDLVTPLFGGSISVSQIVRAYDLGIFTTLLYISPSFYFLEFLVVLLHSNFNGLNSFGTMKISSRQG